MRGKASINCMQINSRGITPAHAGKSFNNFFAVFVIGDHPRTCGEKIVCLSKPSRKSGSPPHMRGKGCCNLIRFHNLRITPAHAGKSVKFIRRKCIKKDHPRTCGEKFNTFYAMNENQGSPPHMRGKVFFVAG